MPAPLPPKNEFVALVNEAEEHFDKIRKPAAKILTDCEYDPKEGSKSIFSYAGLNDLVRD